MGKETEPREERKGEGNGREEGREGKGRKGKNLRLHPCVSAHDSTHTVLLTNHE